MNQNEIRDSRWTKDEEPAIEMSEAEIDANLEESFPASDPPSWTLGSNHRAERAEQKSDDDEQER